MADRPGGLFSFLSRRLAALRESRGLWGDVQIFVGVALAATVIALALEVRTKLTTPFRFVENMTYDFRIAQIAPPVQKDFVVVKMDDAADEAMSEASPCHCLAPINKAWLGDLLAALDKKGAKAIVVDYLLDTWNPDNDNAEFKDFERRVADTRAPIVVGADPQRKPNVDYPVDPKLHYADSRALVHNDFDNVIRIYDPKPSRMRALSAEAAVLVGVKPPTKPFDIRYRAPYPGLTAENTGAIAPSYSAAFVPFVPDAFIKDKIVFVGAVARSAHADADSLPEDMHATPLRFRPGHDTGTPGVEVHVHALSQMLAGDRVHMPSPLVSGLIVFIAALGGTALGRGAVRWWMAIGVVLGGMVVSILVAFAIFSAFAFVMPMTSPGISFAVAFFIMSRLAAAELQNQRAFYSSTLERYLAPQVIDNIVEGKEAVKIGAEAREITVMISDLENFSNLVASLPLETFQHVINGYLDGILEILWNHGAMIDKMTGDGVITMFGAPVSYPDHADRALACAREIDAFAEKYRGEMLEQHGVFGRTRMGLDSGVGLVGNFGGERRFNYTAYGEVVVIAARLEAANKTFGTRILFSAETKRLATATEGAHAVGEIDLKGVPIPVEAYTLT